MFDADEAPAGAPQWPKPGEVWSLWEMLKVDGSEFYEAASQLAWLNGVLAQHAHSFPNDANNDVDADHLLGVRSSLQIANGSAETLGATVTALAITETLDSLKGINWKQLNAAVQGIQATFRRELSLTCLFVIERDQAKLFESTKPLFGADVEKAFPAAAFEIEEAAKCLALSRPTAAVFHLMRVMEVGLRATANCLGIPDPVKDAEKNWGTILRKIREDELDQRGKTGGKAWPNPKDKQFFSEIYGSLDAVRVAWRNSTMHVENKYTDDEAEHIWIAVKGFMRKLAGRCDEQGQPLA